MFLSFCKSHVKAFVFSFQSLISEGFQKVLCLFKVFSIDLRHPNLHPHSKNICENQKLKSDKKLSYKKPTISFLSGLI